MNLYQFMLVYQDVFNPKYLLLFSIILMVLYDWKILEHLRTRNFHSGAGHLSRSSGQTTCSSLRHSRNHDVQQAFGWCARHTAKRCRFHPWHFNDAFRSKNTSAKFTRLPVVGRLVKVLMNWYTITQHAAWILTPEEAKMGLWDKERFEYRQERFG